MNNNVTTRFTRDPRAEPTVARFAWWRSFERFCMIVVALCFVPVGGFSTTILGEVNENDAIAAVRVWSRVIAHERGIPVDPQPIIFRNITEISAALTSNAVDCISLTTGEYDAVSGQVARDSIVTGVMSDSIMEEYVLLVPRGSNIERLSDLRGRTLGLLQSARASLAAVWLDTLLVREGLGSAADFFGQIASPTKIGKAVLTVFFRQVDACVVTRRGFETMIELNPQTGQQLKVLAISLPVVPVIFCFRASDTSPIREQIMVEITRWHLSPSGMQILTLFQTDSLEEHSASCLDSALELLAEHKRLFGETNIGPAGKTPGETLRVAK